MDEALDRWLTVREAALYMNVSEDLMRERIGKIPGAGRTLGETGDWRVKASMIDAYMTGEGSPGDA
jgi:hypothetical protein